VQHSHAALYVTFWLTLDRLITFPFIPDYEMLDVMLKTVHYYFGDDALTVVVKVSWFYG